MKQFYLYSLSFVLMAAAGMMTYKFSSTLLHQNKKITYSTQAAASAEISYSTTATATATSLAALNPEGECVEHHTGEQKIIADLMDEMDGHATSSDIQTRMADMGMMPDAGGCSEASVIMVDLRGSPNFAQTDLLVTCGAPDTLAILMYTNAPNPISGLTFTVDLPKGLEYGGFVETKSTGTIQELNISDTEHPTFLIPELTQEEFIVVHIGVKANCEGSHTASSYFIDYGLTYNYIDSDGLSVNCTNDYTPNTEYNNAVKLPVLNTLSVSPSNLNFTRLDQVGTQLIEISQDGLDSYLNEFTFKVNNLDLSQGIEIINVTINNAVEATYNYDAATQMLTAIISGDEFLHNIDPLGRPADDKFDTSERINLYVNYRMPECKSTPLQDISYSAGYSCSGNETACQSPSFQPASIEQNPDFAVSLDANATLIQSGGFCGDNVIIDLALNGTEAHPTMGLIEDMKVVLATCGEGNVDVFQLTIGNTIMPANTYGINGGLIELYLTNITSDPDGPGIGLEDIDGDGRFDDLPGGNGISARLELALVCPSTVGTCQASGCEINQITAQGLANCGEDQIAITSAISPAVTFQYDSDTNFPNETVLGASTGYNFGTFTTGSPATRNIQVCYTATVENLDACTSGNTYMEVILRGRDHEVFNAAMTNAQFENTSAGIPTITDDTDTNTRRFKINAGNSTNNQQFCYSFDLTFDACVCAPPTYLSLETAVIEECGGSCTCALTKSCASTLLYTDPDCTDCSCDINTVATVERLSLGYTDKSLATKLTRDQVAPTDLNRFMPGDTAIITAENTILNAENVNLTNYYFNFAFENRRIDYAEASLGTEGMQALMDGSAMKVYKLEYIPVSTGIAVDLGNLSCTNADPNQPNHGMRIWGPDGSYMESGCPLQPAFPNMTSSQNLAYNDGRDFLDQYLIGAYFYNYDDNNIPSNSGGDCVTPLFEAIGGAFHDGDILRLSVTVPLVKNPVYDPSQHVDQVFVSYVQGFAWDNDAQTQTLVASNCQEPGPFSFHAPELEISNTLELTDCGAEIEHTLSLQNPPPADWYQNEYRPILGLSQLETTIPAPLIYGGAAQITNTNGVTSSVDLSALGNAPISTDYNGTTYHTANANNGGNMTLKFQDSEYENGVDALYSCDEIDEKLSGGSLPIMGVGLNHNDQITLRIPLEKLCADPINPSDFQVDYDYSYLYLPDYNTNTYACHGLVGPSRGECSPSNTASHNQIYFREFTRTSETNPHFFAENSNVYQITDNSTAFPTLMASIQSPTLVDLYGAPELNTLSVCTANDGSATHQNVVAAISVPNSIELRQVSEGSNNLAFDLAKTTNTHKIYSVALADLPPNTCIDLEIETEQLFCGSEPNDSRVCLSISSGCLSREKAAAILGQTNGAACSSASDCYFYDIQESGIQAEALKSPAENSTLCSEIELAIRIKNVKASQLNELVAKWWLPQGLTPIAGTWELSYPNGPTVQEPFISISDAITSPSDDNPLGTAYTYADDADFSTFIDQNGLQGISAATALSDSNQLVIRFKALTTCDEFISGAKMYFDVTAGGACEALVSSGAAVTNDIIVSEADPKDFAQILTVIDPLEVNCGAELPLGITGLNVSENGGTTMNTEMIVMLPEGITFTGSTVNFTTPVGFTPTAFTTEQVGNNTQLSFDLPDGISPNNFFKFEVPVAIEETLGCGNIDLLADIVSFIPSVECSTDDNCGAYVRNAINAVVPFTIKPPLNLSDLEVVSLCENDPNNVDLEYSFNLENTSTVTYNDAVTVEIIQDLNGNLIADEFEPALATATENISLAAGTASTQSGTLTIPESGSCPSIIKLTYETTCTCSTDEIVLDQIKPKFFSDLGDKVLLCPDDNLVFSTCGDVTYELSPSTAGTINIVNDEVTVALADGEGVVTPVFLNLTSSQAACDFTFSLPMYQIEDFQIGPYDTQVVCEEACTRLNLQLPGAWEDNVTVLWSPADFLDDPTSSSPEICDPTANVNYTVTVTNPAGPCTTTATYPVIINPTTINSVVASDCQSVSPTSSNTTVTVNISWATPAIADDVINVSIGSLVQTIDPHTTNQPAELTFTLPATGMTEEVLVNYAKNPSCQDAFTVALPQPCHTSLGNYVWEDLDYDGMQDDNEPPIEGVKVTLYECNAGVKGSIVGMTTTDADGLYLFTGLEAGEYCVHFDPSMAEHTSVDDLTFTQNNNTGEDALDSDANPIDGCTPSVTLAVGEQNRDLDAGLYAPAKLGDFVWEDLNNNGVQDADEPGIEGVEITLTYFAQDGMEVPTTTTTGPNGEYCFPDLVPGDYKVTFDQPENTLPTDANTGDDATDSDADPDNMLMSEVVTLVSADTLTTIDGGFFTPVSVGDVTFVDVNYDGIQDAGDLPLEGVTVTLHDTVTGDPVTTDAEGNPILPIQTDTNGEYLFDNLPPGNYYVNYDVATAENGDRYQITQENVGNDTDVDSDINTDGESDPTGFLESGDSDTSLDAGFYIPAKLGDFVWNDLNKNGVQDADEPGIEGVEITLTYFDQDGTEETATTTTGPNGEYCFPDLLPGDYKITFGQPEGTLPTDANEGDDATDSDADPDNMLMSEVVTLVSADTLTTIDGGFFTPVSVGDKTFVDVNYDGIQDADDLPLEGVTVTLYDAVTGDPVTTDAEGNPITPIQTDANGEYLFDNLPPGNYYVTYDVTTAEDGDLYQITQENVGNDTDLDSDINADGESDETGYLADGESDTGLDAGFYIPAKLGDFVWEDLNNNGVQDADEPGIESVEITLTYFAQDGMEVPATTTTGPNGEYCFPDLVPGDYKVTFDQPENTLPTDANEGDDATDSDADPDNMLMSEVVTLISADTLTTIDGGFFTPVSVGDKTFIDTNYNGIQDTDDLPLEGVTITLYNCQTNQPVTEDAEGNPIISILSDENGMYTFDNLLPGDYYVVFDVSTVEGGNRFEITQENVGDDAELDSDVNADGQSEKTGFLESGETDNSLDAGFYVPSKLGDFVWDDLNNNGVQDAGEPGIANAEVTLTYFDQDNNPIDTMLSTGPNGEYCFPDLVPGRYKVTFGQPEGMFPTLSGAGTDATNNDANPDNMLMSEVLTIVSGDTIPTIDGGFINPVTVGDKTFVDVNYDGIQDAGDLPLEGVTVTLYDTVTGDPVTTDAEGNPITPIQTDVNGEYLFDNLPPGNYYVKYDVSTVENGNLYQITQENVGNDTDLDSDINTNGESDQTGYLASGESDTGLDAGFYIPAKLGDFVWDDLNNNGVQDAGEPGIANAEVTLTYFDQDNNPIDTMLSTGPNGEYCFPDLVPGRYKVTFGQPEGTLPTDANTGDDATDSDADPDNMLMSEIVTLVSADTLTTIDGGFFTPVTVGDKTFVDVNYNGIQDADDLPLEGVTVTLFNCATGEPVTVDAEGNPILPTLSDANGMYSFDNLPPGDYYVVFDASTVEGNEQYEITQENVGDDSELDSDVNADGQSEKTGFLESGDTDNSLDAGFYVPAKLGDFVWDDLNNNGIQDAGEPGIANAEVTLTYFDQDNNPIDTMLSTGPNGEYCFPDLVPGRYKVTFGQPEGMFPTLTGEGTDATNNDADPDNMLMSEVLTIVSGDTIPTIDGGFINPVTVGDKTFVDVNYDGIQDADDLPLEGVTVTLYDVITGLPVTEDAEGNPIMPIQTDVNGEYLFDNLPPGNYYVKYDVSTVENGNLYQITQENVGNDTDLDSDINADGESDQTGYLASGESDTGLDAGFYIPAKLGDFVWDDLNHNGIQDADEPGIEGAMVTLTYFDQEGNPMDTTLSTGPNGEYCFPDLVPGDYKVTFGNPADMFPTEANNGDDATDSDADPDNMLMSEVVTLTSGDTLLTIDAGFYSEVGVGNYTFIDNNANGIQDAGDAPLAGVTVTLYSCTTNLPVVDNDNNEVMTMVTDENGLYLFTNLPPGDYYVVFDLSTTENGENYVTTLENTGDDSTLDSDVNEDGESDKTGFLNSGESNLTLDAGYYVPGKLGDFVWEDYNANGIQDEGEPGIAGVEVTLTRFNEDGTTTDITVTTGVNGEYCFPDLPPSPYKVTFEQPASMSPTLTGEGDETNNNDADPDNMLMSEVVTTISGDTITSIDGGFLALDFGDNPDSFGTTEGENGASHVIVPNKYLGLGVDAERDGSPSPMAGFDNLDGDDNTASDYTQGTVTDSDEDGIQFLTPLIPGEEACIAVSSTLAEGEGYLTAWMDFDGNGEFTTTEQIQFNVNNVPTADAPLPLGTNTTEFCFIVPADATFAGGQTFSRFRMSCEIGTQATGQVVGGEVEDYFTPLAKVGSLVWMDYNSDGIQNEPAAAGTNGMTVTLTAAGPNGILGDTDDLVYTTVTMDNANGEPGYYTFCGLPEGDYQLELDPQGLVSTTLNATSEDQDANSFVQTFSIGHLADDQPTGENGMNETNEGSGFPDSHENLTFDFGFPGYDYGDLPASFSTLFADNGARHIVNSDLYLGTCVDIEVNGAADATAGEGLSTGGDNGVGSPLTRGTCDNENNDENGIEFITPLIPGEEACIKVTANSPDGDAFLNAWIDFNGDGDFANDADEQVIFMKVDGIDLATATNQGFIPTGNTTQIFCFTVPATATFDGGETHLRFRLSSAGDLTYEGMALDGEVEDYWLPLAKVGSIAWHDVNFDGTQDDAVARGVNEVQIDLVTTGADGIPGTSDDLTYTTYTSNMNGQDGAYMFTGLITGIYTINVVSPANYEPTWDTYTDSNDNDSNNSGITFAIPNLTTDFLVENEDEAADNPGGFNNFPDTHDDLTFDFGFVAFDYGDLPGGFPTNNADNGARHSIGSGYYLGGCVDAEEDGAPQANAGQIGEGGDDNSIGELNDGDCSTPNDADGVVLLTEMIPGYEACIRVNSTAPNSSAVLNAWIDFNGDGNFENDPEEQLVFTAIDGTELATATDQGFIPQGQVSQVMCFQVPADAVFDGGETHFRYRLSTQGNLSYNSFASDGEVEDYWQPLAKIGNLVWEDTNYDGSQDSEAIETGINDVEIRLTTPGIDGILGTDDDLIYLTKTANIDGVDGKYGFCGLISGEYKIEVERPTGYYPTYADNTGNDIIDHDGEEVTFTIPDLINDFLTSNENSAGDNPGQTFNFPDGHDDLSFDFGFTFAANLVCLAQVGDLNGDGDIQDEFETENDSSGIPVEFNANGIVEVEGCNMPIPDQVMRIDFGYDDQAINPLFEYDVLLNGNVIVTGAVPSRDTAIITLLGSDLIVGDNTIKVELYFNNGVIRTLEDDCEHILPVVKLQTTVACNTDLNIGLGQECMSLVTPDMLLEGLCDDEDTRNNYELNLTLLEPAASFMNPQNIELSGIIDNGTNAVKVQVPGRYRYTANLGSLNCWGEFTLEDKSAPVCKPALDEELPIAYDIDCDGVVETFVNDPSGEDDLTNEYILCTLLESNGVAIYFDELELMDEIIDLDNDGEGDGNGNGIGDIQVRGDFADCTGLESIHFEEETIDVCALTDLQGLPIDTSKYDVNAFEISAAYSRTWFAIDKNGIQSTTGCTQFVFALRPKVSVIELDQEVVIDCTENPADLDASTAPYFTVDNRIINNGTGSDGPNVYDTDNDEDTPSIAAGEKVYAFESGVNTCHYASSFQEDPATPICTGSYKQVRHWTLVDWCDGQRVYDQFTQLIKVVDTKAPVLVLTGTEDAMPTINTPEEVAMGVDTIIGTKIFDCEANGNLPLFILKDDCSTTTIDRISIERNANQFAGEEHIVISDFTNPDGTPANGGSLNELNLPKGTYTVTYYFSDDCGNTATKTFTFGIEDTSIPSAICNDELIVSLIPTGTVGDQQARIYGEDLDDTSFDGCHPVIFEIRSNDNANTNDDAGALGDQWYEYVEFNCADVGNEDLKVELRVTEDRNDNGRVDEGELSNLCWGYVRIEDKTTPVLVAEDVNLDCNDLALTSGNLQTTLGTLETTDPFPPTLVGGCSNEGVTIELLEVNTRNYDANCERGTLIRTFRGVRTLHDNVLYSQPITQTISIGFVSDWAMTFPTDELIECDGANSNLDLVPAPLDITEILNNEGCDQWGMEVNDEVFDIQGQDGDGACFKIIRTYKFINWCTWDPTNSELGIVNRPSDMILAANEKVQLRHRSFNLGINEFGDEDDADIYDEEESNDDGDALSDGTDLPLSGDFTYDNTDGALVIIGEEASNPLGNNNSLDFFFDAQEDINGNVVRRVYAENYGYFAYRQIIKVKDSQAPIIASLDDQVILDTLGTCGALVTLCGPEVTECKATYDTDFTVFDATDNIISRGQFLEGATPNDCVGIGTLSFGDYRVVYNVTDGCGNNTSITYNITILDGKAPTAYCNGGTSIDLMTTGMVEIWASDLDAGSFDDCSTPITVSFDPAGTQKNLVLTCEDIGVNLLNLYVTDAAGNQSFCETIVFVQANDAADCETGGLKVAGLLQTEAGDAMEGATVFVSGMMNENVTSPATGAYEFDLTTGGDYSIFPENDTNPQNGVSTFDLVLIRKHILGVTDLDSPYKMIAADVNRSKSITTLDMLLLRKMILGITNDLDNNTSWRFVDQAFVFPDPSNPWASEFPEVINFNNLTDNRLDANFIAIKVGDVNNSAIPNALVTNDERDNLEDWSINTEELYLTAGETYILPFYASETGMQGYQFTLHFDTEVLEVVNVQAGIADEDNFGFQQQEEGILTTSWNGEEITSTTETLFYLEVKAKADGRLSQNMYVSSQVVAAQAYDTNGGLRNVSIYFPSYARLTPESALYQNFPNPFTEQTTIDFSLATASNATLTITDAAGKVLWKYQDNFTKGNQSVTISSKDLPNTGVLFYHLATPDFSATKRMIFTK